MSFKFRILNKCNSHSIETYSFRDLVDIKLNYPNNCPKMNVKEQLDQLRIPDAIKDLPHFDGNSRTLFDFIENVKEILALVKNLDGTPSGKIILRAVRNKIVGEANEVLNMYGTPLQWETIRDNLVNHYSDKRNETSLVRDLHRLSQGGDSIELYYSKIIDIYSTIMNNIKINEKDQNVLGSKQTLYEEMCRNIFLSGIREPLGSTVRAMRPNTLSEAFCFCLKEQNISYLKTPNYNKNNTPIKKPLHIKPLVISQPNNTYYRSNAPINFPSSSQPRFHHNQYNQFTHHRPNFQPNFNAFRPNFNQARPPYVQKPAQHNHPQPMDTSSGHSKFKNPTRYNNNNNGNNNNFFRATGQPRFHVEELFTLENNSLNNSPNNSLNDGNHIHEHNSEYSYYNNYPIENNPQPDSPNEHYCPIENEIDDQDFPDKDI